MRIPKTVATPGWLTRHRWSLALAGIAVLGTAGVLTSRPMQGIVGPTPAQHLVVARERPVTAFPLRAERGLHHLTDDAGRPFLVHGDTAWSLIADLTREETEIYLADRRARGFNTLLVSLIEHKFAVAAPRNAYREPPFPAGEEFATPSDAYFRHADWVLARARDLGFLVLLTPSYTGWVGGDEGWWTAMVRAGPETLRAYGRYLGERYRAFDNIVWVAGGDDDPPDRSLVEAVALGIKDAAPRHLHTSHNGIGTRIDRFWKEATWLDLWTVYVARDTCERSGETYRADGRRPFFLIEGHYENEHGAGPQRIRQQAYHALLCGAGGHVYGNNPIWHFKHTGLFPAPADWWQSLGSGGAVSMTRLGDLFQSLPWWRLVPDLDGKLIVEGARRDGDRDRAVAARTADGTLAVVYSPGGRSLLLDIAHLGAAITAARWVDPVSGESRAVDLSSLGGAGGRWRVTTPGANAGGDGDWVLVIDAARPPGASAR